MSTEGTAAKTALDKPLHELTEDDISQITREDCRRYLKEKGMRRPSWNKSQAIQQVIMLKTLLETTLDSESGSRKRIHFSRPNNISVPKGSRNVNEDSMSAGETAPYSRNDLDNPDSSSGGLSGHFLVVNNGSTPSRITGLPSIPVGQMTIIYSGKVNVYDDVPQDKAQSILSIAASPLHIPQEQPVDGTMIIRPSPCLSKAVGVKARPDSAVLLQTLQKGEGPSSTRKASLQRYLDKKKERFKSKRKAGKISFAELDMYFNHQILNEPLCRSNTCSPPQIRPPSTPKRCGSVVSDSLKNVNNSTDLIN